jgi:hypothetical protein
MKWNRGHRDGPWPEAGWKENSTYFPMVAICIRILGVLALVAWAKFDGWMDGYPWFASQRPINNPRIFNEWKNWKYQTRDSRSKVRYLCVESDFYIVMLGDGMIPHFIDGAA